MSPSQTSCRSAIVLILTLNFVYRRKIPMFYFRDKVADSDPNCKRTRDINTKSSSNRRDSSINSWRENDENNILW